MASPTETRLTETFGTLSEQKGITTVEANAFLYAAQTPFENELPTILEWLQGWEVPASNIYLIHLAERILRAGWPHVAWALAQLHYDQEFKEAVRTKQRRNLGHPAWGVAQLAAAAKHSAAERYYAILATIADVLSNANTDFRGSAPHNLARTTDWQSVEAFISRVDEITETWPRTTPVYPEAILAARWFPGREDCILKLAEATVGLPFVERLLKEAPLAATNVDKGTFFEAAAGLLLSVTPGFEVRGAAEDESSQTDLLVTYRTDPSCNALLPNGYALVECK